MGMRIRSPKVELMILLYAIRLEGNFLTQIGETIAAMNSLMQYTALASVTNCLL